MRRGTPGMCRKRLMCTHKWLQDVVSFGEGEGEGERWRERERERVGVGEQKMKRKEQEDTKRWKLLVPTLSCHCIHMCLFEPPMFKCRRVICLGK